jgi:SagB-type dehydrogenase family enzyme
MASNNFSQRERQPGAPEAGADRLFSPSEIYHENSKLRPGDLALFTWIGTVNSSTDIRQIIARPFTHYPGAPSVALPRDFPPSECSLEEAMTGRRSVHRFSSAPVGLATLAKILYMGGGIVCSVEGDDGVEWSLRAAPSGGGLYPCGLYCAASRVEGLTPGLYFYDPLRHALELVAGLDPAPALAAATNLREEVCGASACVLISAAFARSKFKYGERAYRFVLLEAGHIAQNLLLAAQAEGLGSLPVGGFMDDPVNDLLQLDGVEEAVLYLVLIGHTG